MSTRSVIAVVDPNNPLDVMGVYVHSDGYPGGVGDTLYNVLHAAKDPQNIIGLIMSKVSGWSSICGWNGSEFYVIGFDAKEEMLKSMSWEKYFEESRNLAVYYDGSRANAEDTYFNLDAISNCWAEYLYIIEGTNIHVYSVNPYKFIGSVSFVDDKPNWEEFEGLQEEL